MSTVKVVSLARSSAPTRQRDLRRWAPVLLLAAVVAVGVHLWGLYRVTGPPSPPWFPQADKVEHLIGFGLPVCLILLATTAWIQRRRRVLTTAAVVVVPALFVLHAVISEVVQHYAYATRSGDPLDAVADLVGVLVGFVVYRWIAAVPTEAP